MIAFASLMGLMMAATAVDFSDAADDGTGLDEDEMPENHEDRLGHAVPRFSFEDLLNGAVTTDAFADPEHEMASYLEDEAALDAVADGSVIHGETAGYSGLDEWLELTGDGPSVIDEYDEAEDALFVVYDAAAHPDPVLGVEASENDGSDAVLTLDGMPLAVVSGGAGLDLTNVQLVPEGDFPMALAAGA